MGNKKKEESKNKKKKNEELKTVEFKVSMYCNACERTVAKTISKFKGVEKFITDMGNHKVVVTGRFDPHKMMKKLKKKTGKRVEIVVDEEEGPEKDHESSGADDNFAEPCEGDYDADRTAMAVRYQSAMFDCKCRSGSELFVMFSDENPNACCIL